MKFGPVPLSEAEGTILVHSARAGGLLVRKGQVLGAAEITALEQAGIVQVTVAKLDLDDVEENQAASRVSAALAGAGVTADRADTGRVYLRTAGAGVLTLDPEAVDRLNAIDETVTLATLAPFASVERGQIVATVKIIPFAVPASIVEACVAQAPRCALSLHGFRPLRARLIQTTDERIKPSTLDKTARITEARIARLGGQCGEQPRVAHDPDALAQAIAGINYDWDLLMIAGASAITDRRDVIPAAITASGGRIERLGMPVDPGNLILVGALEGRPVLGLPGCARSPARNGLDWVLERIAAGLPVGAAEIGRMGVGGYLHGADAESD